MKGSFENKTSKGTFFTFKALSRLLHTPNIQTSHKIIITLKKTHITQQPVLTSTNVSLRRQSFMEIKAFVKLSLEHNLFGFENQPALQVYKRDSCGRCNPVHRRGRALQSCLHSEGKKMMLKQRDERGNVFTAVARRKN